MWFGCSVDDVTCIIMVFTRYMRIQNVCSRNTVKTEAPEARPEVEGVARGTIVLRGLACIREEGLLVASVCTISPDQLF